MTQPFTPNNGGAPESAFVEQSRTQQKNGLSTRVKLSNFRRRALPFVLYGGLAIGTLGGIGLAVTSTGNSQCFGSDAQPDFCSSTYRDIKIEGGMLLGGLAASGGAKVSLVADRRTRDRSRKAAQRNFSR